MVLNKITTMLLLVATFAFANWTGEINEPELRTKIDGKVFYLISTPEELAWFAAQVNSGKTEINAKLSMDIVLWEDSLTSDSEATSWTPIGDSLTKSFNGVFDGDNHKIRGLYVRKIYTKYQSDSICLGLFGCLDDNAIIKNLSVENAYICGSYEKYNSTKDLINIGGVIGINNGRIENVSFKGVLSSGGKNTGGLVGKNNGQITDVFFEGNVISGYGYIGGIVGFNTGSVKNAVSTGVIQSKNTSEQSFIGGIVGYMENGLSIESCENHADIIGNGKNTFVGGIVGRIDTSTIIKNSTNKGTLQSASSEIMVGGIVGVAGSTIIDNCKNEGTIKEEGWSGGIIASGGSVIIRNCINNGSIAGNQAGGIAIAIDSTSTIDNCINNGIMKASGAAGIVNRGRGTVINCVNNDSIVGKGAASGIGDAKVIENCINNGVVISESEYSSTCGETTSRIASSGGIALIADTIKNCTNNGSVSVSVIVRCPNDAHNYPIDVYAGGIAAHGSYNGHIAKSVNNGHVSAYSKLSHQPRANYGSSSCCRREVYAGGITGIVENSKITDSYNLGSVVAKSVLDGSFLYENGIWVGGIAGKAGSVQNVYSAADSVIGYISGGAKNYTYNGALFGQAEKVNNAYYDLKIKYISVPLADKNPDTVNVSGLSTTNMQKDQFAWSLNTTAGTQENTSIWSRKDSYPFFANTDNLPIYRVTFDDDGASNYYRYTYEYSNNKGLSSVPKNLDPAEGYRFVAWVKENGNVFDGKQIVPEDMTVSALYVPFSAKIYSVTFEYPKGREIAVALTNDNGMLNKIPEAPLMNENYQFKGWYDSSSSLVTTSTVFTANAIVTAVYESLSYSSSGSFAKSSGSSANSSDGSTIKSSDSSAKSSNSVEKNTDVFIAGNNPIFHVSVMGRNIQIVNAKIYSAYAVFDMQGRVLKNGRVESANFNISMTIAGNYLVRVGNRTQRITIK